MKKKLLPLLVASLLTMLTACNQSGDGKDNGSSESGTSTSQGASNKDGKKAASKGDEQAIVTKYNHYIGVKNDLLDYKNPSHLITDASRRWALEAEEAVKKGKFEKIKSSSRIKSASEKLGKALAEENVQFGELDGAAAELKKLMDNHLPQWEELEAYNRAKKYEDDKGAKGKELLASYLEFHQKLDEASKKFDDKLVVVVKEQKAKEMAAYKASGDMLSLHKDEALDQALEIIDLFEDQKNMKNAASIEKANEILTQLDENLESIDKEYKEAKEAGKIQGIDYTTSLHSNLISFTANYREFRKGGKDSIRKYNSMIDNYNSAIKNKNGRL